MFRYYGIPMVNGEFEYSMQFSSSTSTGQPVRTSQLAITGLVSTPNLLIGRTGIKIICNGN